MNARVDARPGTFLRIALAEVGTAEYELISPVDGESVYTEHLRSKGERFHHTRIAYPTREALHAARDELSGHERELIQGGTIESIGESAFSTSPRPTRFCRSATSRARRCRHRS